MPLALVTGLSRDLSMDEVIEPILGLIDPSSAVTGRILHLGLDGSR